MGSVTRLLGEICDEVDGVIRTGPFGSQLHESDYRPEGVPVVMPKDIIDGKVSAAAIAKIGEEDVARLVQHKLRKGDIVYGRRGDIGRRALITDREMGWLCGTGCLRISLGATVLDPAFLYYYLGQPRVISLISNQAIGATMPNLNTSIIRNIPIFYPPLSEQRKIASILSAYDDLIENNNRRIKILEGMAQAIYKEWFVNFYFPGHKKVKMVKSKLGMIPAGWEVKTLGDVCHILMGQSPKSEFYNTIGDGLPFHQGVTDFGRRFPTHSTYCTVENRIAEKGDILLSVRAPVGRINVANTKLVIGRGLSAVRHREDLQSYLYYQLKTIFTKEDSMGSGSIFKAVTKEDMHGIKLLVPNRGLDKSFDVLAMPIDSQVENLSIKNENLRKTRDLLLPKLISGEIALS